MSLACIPGIYGFGTETRHAWGGPVAPQLLRVRTLNDSGADSFRAAIEANFPRIIVFEVSGVIVLLTPLKLVNHYVHIAGQTAPSPGICVIGNGFQIGAHDVLMEHFRVRPGWTGANCNDACGLYDGTGSDPYNVVMSCMSFSWGQDENLYVIARNRPANFAFWRSITSENLNRTPGSAGCTGSLEDGHGFLLFNGAQHVAIIQSLFAHNVQRNPFLENATSCLMLNDIVFDWYKEWCFFAGIFNNADFQRAPWLATVVGNRHILGPNTVNPADGDVAYEVYVQDNEGVHQAGCQLYLLDNTLANDPDNKVIAFFNDGMLYDPRVSTPPISYPGYTPLASTNLEANILPLMGARPTDPDSVDTRIKAEVLARTGVFPATQNDVGGYPSLAVNRRSLTPPDNFNDVMSNGYTRGEMWLFGFSVGVGDTTTVGAPDFSLPTVIDTGGGVTDPGGGTTDPGSGTQGTPPVENDGEPTGIDMSLSGIEADGTRTLRLYGVFPDGVVASDLAVTFNGTPITDFTVVSATPTLLTLSVTEGVGTYCAAVATG